jgi:hypothetical protein
MMMRPSCLSISVSSKLTSLPPLSRDRKICSHSSKNKIESLCNHRRVRMCCNVMRRVVCVCARVCEAAQHT